MRHLQLFFCLLPLAGWSQEAPVAVRVRQEGGGPLAGATVEWLRPSDSALQKITVTDTSGWARLPRVEGGSFLLRVQYGGQKVYSGPHGPEAELAEVLLPPATSTLAAVSVSARKPFIEMLPGKTVVNMESSISAVGANALEALEKLPGVVVDRNGGISIRGRQGVVIMIDGRQTYLSGAEAAALLGGMSAAQIAQIEIITQPGASFDAAGNAGIIHIKTIKGAQRGLHGSISASYTQGVYTKTNNSFQLNLRRGKWNANLQLNANSNPGFTRIYALRRYFDTDGKTVVAQMEQPTYMNGESRLGSLRTGLQFQASARTSLGLNLNGTLLRRSSFGNNTAEWGAGGSADSLIQTTSESITDWKQGGLNLSFRHSFTPDRELGADLDLLAYRTEGSQYFENSLIFPNTYTEATRAGLPANIDIRAGRIDYRSNGKTLQWEAGLKSSRTQTDNAALYEVQQNGSWEKDDNRTNHFLYDEQIHAVYASAQGKKDRWSAQGGLRYEYTHYKARQLGNDTRPDSSFSRSYASLFPNAQLSYDLLKGSSLTLMAGRRIDRPAFQKLNPFVYVINKYTYQQGNPYYKPQYTWNLELQHSYRNKLVTGLSYSITDDYFSQVFFSDTSGVVIYTEGNLGRREVWGLSLGINLAPLSWWSFTANINLNHKKMDGQLWRDYEASITQVQWSSAHQFRIGAGWSGELSGFYNGRSQNDLQEVLYPTGQVSVGLSKSIWKEKATLRLAFRDIFYTQAMEGLTYFENTDEYFKLTRDSRVGSISFSYRFGKVFKAARRSDGSAGEEMKRVGQ